MSQDINLKQITNHGASALKKARVYATFIFIITVLLIYSFLVLRISVLSQAEPSEAEAAEQAVTVKRLKIDQNAIDKIEELEDQNIAVQSLFQAARDNPFQD